MLVELTTSGGRNWVCAFFFKELNRSVCPEGKPTRADGPNLDLNFALYVLKLFLSCSS